MGWLMAWIAGIAIVLGWDRLYLEAAAYDRMLHATWNTLALGVGSVILATGLGWVGGSAFYFLETRGNRRGYAILTFAVNLVRSIPQVLGILLVYFTISRLIESDVALGEGTLAFLLACGIAVFVSIEVIDLVRDRIAHFAGSDFVAAMLVCGIAERKIIHVEILWRNCRTLIFHKATSLLGVTLFLLCSVDFIVSVGLATDVQAVNFPATLGNILARLDSKQDILMLGVALTHVSEWPTLLFRHLQGISSAFLLVFSLICIHQIVRSFHQRLRW